MRLKTISTAGGTFARSASSLNWTMGEAVIETLMVQSTFFTQGFCQPEETLKRVIENLNDAEILVYPNPFISSITI